MRAIKLSPLLIISACAAEPEVLSGLGDTGSVSETATDGAVNEESDGDDDNDDVGDESSDGAATPMTDDGPVGEMCGNDIIDGTDFCDGTDLAGYTCQVLGFDTGELGCTANCAGHDLSGCTFYECGNGTEEKGEDCDGTVGEATCATEGFDNGTLFCTPECEYNFDQCGVCGDRIISPGEDCDTEAPLMQSCIGIGLAGGNLSCGKDCLFDVSGCLTCGNGNLEGDEECDDDGESAVCDDDCTGVRCGDGNANAAAGETCDTSGESVTCNADCTVAVCGDGITNVTASESCDDSGESATCNIDCTDAVCGDGLTNVSAGEDCDGEASCDDACQACPATVLLTEDFSDNSLGWTLGVEWEIGPAIGSVSPGACGQGDPAMDHTDTADNGIAGVVIGGNAATDIHPFYDIVSPPIDATGYGGLELTLWRWLNSDYDPYMHNRIEVWDGAVWQSVFATRGSPGIEDSEWTPVVYNISAYANPALQIRIGFDIDSGGVFTCSGWNVDDIQLLGYDCM